MTEPTPLRDRLGALAADAPDPGALDLDRLHGRISRRRRSRLAAAGGAVALTVAAAGTAVAILVPGIGDRPDGAPVATMPPVQQAFRFGECGEPIATEGPAPDGPLNMIVDLESPTPEGGDNVTLGTVTVTNLSNETITASMGDGPGVVLAEPGGGRVTAQEPVHALIRTAELEPGESLTEDVLVFRYRCVPGEPVSTPNGPVPTGRYEAYVTWSIGTDDRSTITLYGGPFDVEL